MSTYVQIGPTHRKWVHLLLRTKTPIIVRMDSNRIKKNHDDSKNLVTETSFCSDPCHHQFPKFHTPSHLFFHLHTQALGRYHRHQHHLDIASPRRGKLSSIRPPLESAHSSPSIRPPSIFHFTCLTLCNVFFGQCTLCNVGTKKLSVHDTL